MEIAQKYILKGQSKKAIKEYLKLLEASPKDKRLYLKLGDLYLKDGEHDKGIKLYLKLADLYSEEDLNFRAISIYKRVLTLNPKFIEAFHKIAKLYLKEGLSGSAKNYYQSVLRIRPDDQEALKMLQEIENQGQTSSPSKGLSPGESQPPRHRRPPEPKFGQPNAEFSAGEVSEVFEESEVSEASAIDREAEMHYHLGIAYKEMELFDYAISEFEMASTDPAIRFDCCIMLGDCLMEKGNYEKSIDYYKKASEIPGLPYQKSARLYYNLGMAYEANGSASEALKAFKAVLQFDQSMAEAQEKVSRLQKLPPT